MGKIIIKGEFTVETDYGFMNNVKQPLKLLEINCPEIQPFRIDRFSSVMLNTSGVHNTKDEGKDE